MAARPRLRHAVTALALLVAASPLALDGRTPAGQSPAPAAVTAAQPAPPAATRPALAEPGISPDGREIAFVAGGDLWSVPAAGGEARLLVSHPANDTRPLFSPDGRSLAFVSTRTGNGDVYVLEFATGGLRRLTWDDAPEMLDGWAPDGSAVLISSPAREVSALNDVSWVRVSGGTPMPLTEEPYTNEFFGAISPDGTTLAFSARGIASSQWWRHGHSHIDESEIWTLDLAAAGGTPSRSRYRQLVARGAKALWPMWAPDGRSIAFVSDRSGAENLWMRAADGTQRQVTAFDAGRVLWPSMSRTGVVAFEREFGLWTVDVAAGGAPREVPVTLRGAPAGRGVERVRATTQFQSLAVAPDGKKLAFTARGEVFAAGVKDGGDAARVTQTPAAESALAWAPDSRRLAYAAARGERRVVFVHDFETGRETPVTDGAGDDYSPVFSPDGTQLAFVRNAAELRVVTLATGADRLVARAELPLAFDVERAVAWSPDGQWLAFLASAGKGFTNAWVVEAAGGTPRAVTSLAHTFASGLTWSPDGTFLLLVTGQRTEPGAIARVDLVPRTPRFREDAFRELFRRSETPGGPSPRGGASSTPAGAPSPAAGRGGDAGAPKPAPATAVPTRIVFEGIRRRVSLLPLRMDVGDLALSPDGRTLAFTADVGGRENVFTWSLDELAKDPPVPTQVSASAGAKSALHFSPDGKDLVLLDDGRVVTVTLERKDAKPIALTAELDADFAAEKLEVFRQAWSLLRDLFYDEAMHGADWPRERARHEPYVRAASSPDELRRLVSLMIGELDASHLGISAPPSGGSAVTGRLGISLDAAEHARTGRLRVAALVPLGPAALAGDVRVGDVMLAVDGVAVDAATNLEARLEHTVGRQVRLSLAADASGRDRREVLVKPVDLATERGLRYRAWVESRRAYVERASGGRLGYVHVPDMSAASLDQLHFDLDAENHAREGVVIDVRNNNGGFVNVYAIDVFARRPYLTMTLRGRQPAPARTVLGQRALERPTVLVTNQHSLSDAEDFSEGYRTLGLGKVVGEPTAGWIIYTWNTRLVDGSSFRLPRTKITGADGQNMERNPRPVDVPVSRALGEHGDGADSQLDAAVQVLLEGLAR